MVLYTPFRICSVIKKIKQSEYIIFLADAFEEKGKMTLHKLRSSLSPQIICILTVKNAMTKKCLRILCTRQSVFLDLFRTQDSLSSRLFIIDTM